MTKKRNLFDELVEGFDALAQQRAGKAHAAHTRGEIKASTED